jgi:hypothetical protein
VGILARIEGIETIEVVLQMPCGCCKLTFFSQRGYHEESGIASEPIRVLEAVLKQNCQHAL